MSYLIIKNYDFNSYRIFLNNNEIKNQEQLVGIPLKNKENKLKIEQKNIVDLFQGKSVIYKIFCGFFIAIAEGLGGELINESRVTSSYKREIYEALIISEENKDVVIEVCLKQKKKVFIPIGKYFFDLSVKNGNVEDIHTRNKLSNKDKVDWYTIFSLPIVITIVVLVFTSNIIYNIIR